MFFWEMEITLRRIVNMNVFVTTSSKKKLVWLPCFDGNISSKTTILFSKISNG